MRHRSSITLRTATALLLAIAVPVGPVLAEGETAHWSYEGEAGPDAWADLDPAYALCGTGTEQSPVDIDADAALRDDDLIFAYGETALSVINNGHAIQVPVEAGSSVLIDGTSYELQQFHFHSPSEHTLAGLSAPLEVHLVHADTDGNLAVVGVVLDEGAENDVIAAIWEAMPGVAGETNSPTGVTLAVADLLPSDVSAFAYRGSLTTPPCSEGVNWHVVLTPIMVSADQIAAFRALYEGTNRPTQSMNERAFLTPEATGE